jgi:multidrug resistance efflux pump
VTSTAAGPPLSPDEEAQLQREQREAYVTQLEDEVASLEKKMAGWQEALAAKKAELKAAHTDFRKSREG